MNTSRSFAPRLLAGLGTLALVAGVGLFASSRPAHTAGGPVPVSVANTPLATTAADNLALQSVTITNELSNATPGGKASSTFYTVPTGKRLVVDYVSSGAAIPNDTNRYSLFVATFRGNVAQYANFNQLPDSSPYSSASRKSSCSPMPRHPLLYRSTPMAHSPQMCSSPSPGIWWMYRSPARPSPPACDH